MSTRAQRRAAVTAAVAGGGVGIALAFASALTRPSLITSIPTAEPREIDRPVVTESPGAAEMGPLPTLPPPSAGADLSAVMNVLGALLAVAVGVIVILLAVRVARAVAARQTPPEIGDAVHESAVDADDVRDVLRRAREQIALEEDADLAVIRCWESLEALGAAAGAPRRDSDTAAEYVLGILIAFAVPADAATRLSGLYTRALFSAERLPRAAAAEAQADLARLEAALAARASTPAPAPGAAP